MHVLFVHPNFPAQFGHVAAHLARERGWRCTFVSETAPGKQMIGNGSLEKIQYKSRGGARRETHFTSRTFENAVWHTDGVYRALLRRPDVEPDLIVGHSGFGSTLFLRELFPAVPTINLFEYFYLGHDPESDMTFRHDLDWPTPPEKFLRSRCRNAMILLDLQNCQLGYCPTPFQKSRFPAEYQPKLQSVFDGIDTSVWYPRERTSRMVAGVELPQKAKIVTYCSRGFESMRGFDLFMRAVRRILEARDDVHVLVFGTDRIAYGGDTEHTGGKSFKHWTLEHEDVRGYDKSRVHFLGRRPPSELAEAFAASDCHLYLTVPFVLSWSLVNAMACAAPIVASNTSPVRDMVTDGETGRLADFFDPADLAAKALDVLADQAEARRLGDAATDFVRRELSMEAILPKMLAMYDEAREVTTGLEAPRERPETSVFAG
jgi:glycosyltransferase involved in cell wall biosynthesis